MRLARLAAAGLAVGVVAGFAIALLRPRPRTLSASGSTAANGIATELSTDPDDLARWEQSARAEREPAVDVRSRRPVTG